MMNKLFNGIRSIAEKNKKQVVVLAAAFLLLIFLFAVDSDGAVKNESNENTKAVYSLEHELESKLEAFLASVDGVGKVKVCVTFDVLEQTNYAQDVQSDTKESGQKSTSEYVIIENSDRTESGLPISVKAPQIRGVAVACEGGSSAKVRGEVVGLISSVLGISSNRVFVSQYKKSK